MPVKKQCELLGINRSWYYAKTNRKAEDRDVSDVGRIRNLLMEIPFYGYRKVSHTLRSDYPWLSVKRTRRLMRKFGLRAIYPKPNLSKSRRDCGKYPYLLAGKEIRYPNQAWASDITYVKLPGGTAYLTVILDLYSRKILTWRLSNTLGAAFCVQALEESIERYGVPAIFNTDQGCQFTSEAFLDVLRSHRVRISMDGKGRALDNVYVERLWRSLKYENIYLNSYETMEQLYVGIQRYVHFYNTERVHQSHEYLTPDVMYESFSLLQKEESA
jgi:putative transposase